jgi:flavodoxin
MEKVGYRTWGEGKIEQLDMRKIFKTNKFKGE